MTSLNYAALVLILSQSRDPRKRTINLYSRLNGRRTVLKKTNSSIEFVNGSRYGEKAVMLELHELLEIYSVTGSDPNANENCFFAKSKRWKQQFIYLKSPRNTAMLGS